MSVEIRPHIGKAQARLIKDKNIFWLKDFCAEDQFTLWKAYFQVTILNINLVFNAIYTYLSYLL